MALESVDGDVEPAFARRVRQEYQLLDRARPNQGAVRLEDRPEREDPDVVESEGRDGVEIGPDGVRVEVEPVMEPAFARCVVDSEPRDPRGGSAGGGGEVGMLGSFPEVIP